MAETLLSSPFFVEGVLPFVLLFTVLFAILQKTEILGKGKKQIDAITSMVIALIVISFANAVNIINSLLPFLSVSVVVILIFMILYGIFFHGEEYFKINENIRMWGGILAAVAVVIAVMVVTGAWDYVRDLLLGGGSGSALLANLVFVVVIAAAVGLAWKSGNGGGSGSDSD